MSFNTDALLNKRSPLAAVWMASHLERKVAKTVLLKINIPDSVEAIAHGAGAKQEDDERSQQQQQQQQHVEILALRLSGQLLLGVARIYSRKAKYLMDDCSDAILRIKMAFRSGAIVAGGSGGSAGLAGAAGIAGGRGGNRREEVDMPEQDEGARAANINLNIAMDPGGRAGDFELLFNADFGGLAMWEDFGALQTPRAAQKKAPGTSRTTVSRHADITLAEDDDIDLPERPYDNRISPDLGDDMGIGSQEYRAASVGLGAGDELDLGLELDFGLDQELDLGLNRNDDFDIFGDAQASPSAAKGKSAATTSSRVAEIAALARERERQRSSSEVPSVELGRDAPQPRRDPGDSFADDFADLLNNDSSVLKGPADATMSDGEPAFQGDNFEFGGDNFDAMEPGQRTPRASSPQAPADEAQVPTALGDQQADSQLAVDPDATQQMPDMTPRTATRIAEVAALDSAQRKRKEAAGEQGVKARPAKVRKQIIDSVLELSQQQQHQHRDSQASQNTMIMGSNSAGLSQAPREEKMRHGLLKEARYLPQSILEVRLNEVMRDPAKHFFHDLHSGMSSSNNKENVSFYAGPPGLPNELQALFKFTISNDGAVTGTKRAHAQPELAGDGQGPAADTEQRKRARAGTAVSDELPSMEIGRDRQASYHGQNDFDVMFDTQGGPAGDDSTFVGGSVDFDNFDHDEHRGSRRIALEKSPSQFGTPGPGDAINFQLDLDAIDQANASLLSVFDSAAKSNANSKHQNRMSTPSGRSSKRHLSVPGTGRSGYSSLLGVDEEDEELEQGATDETQNQLTPSQSGASTGNDRSSRSGGWSKNTLKALRILEHELAPREDVGREISFQELSHKASRKAAASMFFETLILSTRDCIRPVQEEAYGDITISAKDRLWQVCDGLHKMAVNNGDDIDADADADEQDGTPVAAASSKRANRGDRGSASTRTPHADRDALSSTPVAQRSQRQQSRRESTFEL